MRTIICRFADEGDFFRHLRAGKRAEGDGVGFSLLGNYEVEVGEPVEVVGIVSSVRERCKWRVEVIERRPVAVDASTDARRPARRWNYRCRVHPGDRPWVEMFVEKLRTMRRVRPDLLVG